MDLSKLFTVCNDICKKIRPLLKKTKEGTATQKELNLLAAYQAVWQQLLDDAMGLVEES